MGTPPGRRHLIRLDVSVGSQKRHFGAVSLPVRPQPDILNARPHVFTRATDIHDVAATIELLLLRGVGKLSLRSDHGLRRTGQHRGRRGLRAFERQCHDALADEANPRIFLHGDRPATTPPRRRASAPLVTHRLDVATGPGAFAA